MLTASVFALRDRQRETLRDCLSPEDSPSEWKVLVCDQFSSQIVTTLFPPPAIRRHGITLRTIIETSRAPVPDTPALYLIAPTPPNIARISNDLSTNQLYHRATLVFTTPISRPLLAALAAQVPVPSPITSVKDAYSSFISLEQRLFTLNIPESYVRINAVNDDASLDTFVHSVVDGVFSVLVTLGVIPIIRSQRGGPAEAVSRALDKRLRDNLDLFQRSSLSSRALSFRRPLLLMLDRDFDLNAIFHHTWTYQALVHDCLTFHLNEVELHVAEHGTGLHGTKKRYVLDPETDDFWSKNAGVPFPVVAECIEATLSKYRSDVEEINRKAGGDTSGLQRGLTGPKTMGTSHLAAAIATLPELSKRKEIIDVHTNIATALLENINKRSLDAFFELESQMMSEASQAVNSIRAEDYRAAMLELLKGLRGTETSEKRGEGTAADRLRLFLIYYSIFGRQLSERDMAEFRGVLHQAGADISVIDFVGKLKGYRHDLVSSKPISEIGGTKAAKFKGIMTSVVNRGYRSIANVAQNAKKLIADRRWSVATARVLELFMSEQARGKSESSASDILNGYLLFDPKVVPSLASTSGSVPAAVWHPEDQSRPASARRKALHMVFSDAIVFVVGGGNYLEYRNCMETANWTSATPSGKNVLYGTTEMVTSEGFLTQLSKVAAMRQ